MTYESAAPILLCCLLWAQPGQEAELTAYEDQVLAFVPAHDGAVLQRAISDGADGRPHEIQIYRFADQSAFEAYLGDPSRAKLTGERDLVIARTEVFPVALT